MDWIKEKISITQFEQDIQTLINLIRPNRNKYDCVYGIPRGGLIPAIWISHYLNLPLIDNPSIDLSTLIVDDISDTGKTLFAFKFRYNYDIATLYYKPRSKVKPNYFVHETDKWIVFPYENIEEQPNREI